MKKKITLRGGTIIVSGIILILTNSCKKEDNVVDSVKFNPDINYGTLSTEDGINYKTVTIGNQTWMAENLNTTHYRNGDSISNITDSTEWSKLKTGACCDYDNKPENSATYGKLYNWYVINDKRNIAPKGWHVASNSEWAILIDYLSNNGYNFQGNGNGICKSMSAQSDWKIGNTLGTPGNDEVSNNSSGFTAYPGGNRYYNGSFRYVQEYAFWWSSTDLSQDNAWYSCIYSYYFNVYRDFSIKTIGCSIRCVKD